MPASDGQEVLATLESEEISMALIELDLPDMSGIKVLQKAGKIWHGSFRTIKREKTG